MIPEGDKNGLVSAVLSLVQDEVIGHIKSQAARTYASPADRPLGAALFGEQQQALIGKVKGSITQAARDLHEVLAIIGGDLDIKPEYLRKIMVRGNLEIADLEDEDEKP